MATTYFHSKKIYWAIPATITTAALIFAAVHWFNYHRTGIYEFRWTTGDQAGFNSPGPNFAPDGNPKILVLLPGGQQRCYFYSYSSDLLTYLRKENTPTIPVILELNYSYGKIYSFSILRFGDYHLRDELDNMACNGEGEGVGHLDRYAKPPGLSERSNY